MRILRRLTIVVLLLSSTYCVRSPRDSNSRPLSDQEILTRQYAMKCTGDLTAHSPYAITRCENAEVSCYFMNRGGMNCRLKKTELVP